MVKRFFRILPLYQDLGHQRVVHQYNPLTCGLVFGSAVFKPVLPSPAVFNLGFNSLWCEPIRVLPSGVTGEVCARIRQAVVQRRFADVAGRIVLQVEVARGVHKAQLFHRPVVQVSRVILEGQHAGDVDFADINRWETIHDPMGHDLTSSATQQDA